jgi:hypothetical protein
MYTPPWLALLVCLLIKQYVGVFSADNVTCHSTGQYCPMPYGEDPNNECLNSGVCRNCRACSANAHRVEDCIWKTFKDTKICACDYGFYGNPYKSTCYACPTCTPNSNQTAPCTECTCNPGYYMTSPDSTCQQCPANSYVETSGSTSFTQCVCETGYYMYQYWPECFPCVTTPENAHINDPCSSFTCNTDYFRILIMGYMGAPDHHLCAKELTCSANSRISYERNYMQFCYCDPGYFSSPNTTWINTFDSGGLAVRYQYRENTCIDCTQGCINAQCITDDYNISTCVCNIGYYGGYLGETRNQIHCQICPLGTRALPQGATGCAPCPLGTYGDTWNHCQTCDTGTYSNALLNMCVDCNLGYFSTNPGASACVQCPPGTYGDTWNHCATCDPGKYSDSLLNTCTDCRNGYFSASSGAYHCAMCLAGTYSVRVDCLSCMPGTFSRNAETLCTSCNPGFFSVIPEATGCDACQIGAYTSQFASTACSQCNNGTYSDQNASTCIPCVPGKYTTGEQSTCWECGVGTYQSGYGGSQCDECAPGYTFMPQNGSSICQPCTQCGLTYESYYRTSCSVTMDATCTSCTICKPGEYIYKECSESSNRWCELYPTCPGGTYLSRGSLEYQFPICTPCTICTGDVLVECTSIDDTVCSFNADCHAKTSSFHVYSWMTDGSIPPSKFDGCTRGQYISDLNPLVCGECPPHLYGPNGLWCEPCKGYTEPYVDQTSCVCISPSVIKSGDVCECDVGFFVDHLGCHSCGPGTFKNFSVVLEDIWWEQDVPCLPCPYGSWSFGQASSCFSCLPGQYRANESLLGCESCESGFYALDATRSDSCVACNTSCHPGFSQVQCPLYDLPDRFLCVECDPLPANANWTVDCYYDCSTGFFKFNDTCVPCSPQECPIGFTKQACTLYADINCDVPCTNETKPLFSSVWDKECSWACEKGYVATSLDYGMWTQYECIEESTKPFWLW